MTTHRRRLTATGIFRDLPIFWKLLTPFLVLLFAVGAVGVYIVVHDLTSRSTAAMSDELTLRVVDARAALQSAELDLLESANYASNLQGIADALVRRSSASVGELLRSVLALKSDVSRVAVTDPSGATVADVVRSEDGSIVPASAIDWSTVNPMPRALAAGGAAKASGLGRVGQDAVLSVASPVCRGGGACDHVGFAIVVTSANEMIRAAAARAPGTSDVTLFARDGRLLTSTTSVPPPPPDADVPTEIRQRRMQLEDRSVVTGYTTFRLGNEPGGTLAVTIPAASPLETVGGAALRLVGLFVLAMAAAVVVGIMVSRLVLRQLRGVVETSRALGSGALASRAPVLSNDEHGELAVTLNRMAEQLQASHATLELQVDQRTEEIRRLLQDRSELFAGLSHELRTPLAVILTQAEMLLARPVRRDGVVKATDVIRTSAAQLLEVVNDILEFARAEAGTIEIRPEPVRIDDLLCDLGSTLVALGEASSVTVMFDLPRSLPPVSADRARLREVIVNLAHNAIKYTPAEGKVMISASAVDDEVRIAVADTGIGIPPEIGDRVFDAFYRVPGARPQRDQPSSGLGLALARSWVEAHGGTLRWQPRPGGGTVFEVVLPIAAAASAIRRESDLTPSR